MCVRQNISVQEKRSTDELCTILTQNTAGLYLHGTMLKNKIKAGKGHLTKLPATCVASLSP